MARKEAVRQTGVRLTRDEGPVTLELLVSPLPADPGLFVVIFAEVSGISAEQAHRRAPGHGDSTSASSHWNSELQVKEDYLQQPRGGVDLGE